ncbi:MAG: ATP-binding protein [Nitrospira sp.]|nr:ATP-binding protein [Nitrospira sp.]
MLQTVNDVIYKPKFFENVLRNMVDLLIITNPDATIRFANQVVLDVLGYNLEEIRGIPVGRLFDDSEMKFFGLVKNIISTGVTRNSGLFMVCKNGEKFPVVLNGTVERDAVNKIEAMVWVARDMKDVHQLITELMMANEELEERVRIRTEELQIAKNKSDKAFRDLQQLQGQLVQSEKMASIGQLAAGIAHEINNPTGFVSSNIKTMEEYLKDIKSIITEYDEVVKLCGKVSDKDIQDKISRVEDEKQAIDLPFLLNDLDQIIHETTDGVKRITKIVKDLREFSHTGSDIPEYANINKGLESTLNIVWNELKYKAEVITVYGEIPEVLCYSQQLNQVFMNLLVNAAHAIKEKGTIRINTMVEDEFVVVEVSDTGEGIPPENLSRIFEPFFTTKPVGKGTGLGLAVTYAIIQKHCGEIKVDSEVGKGTTFRVFIHPECENLKQKMRAA